MRMPYNARLPERSIQFMATKQNNGQEEKITALYGRLSDDDGVDMESNSISNQRTILQGLRKEERLSASRILL